MHILIAGCGIGGAALALALQRAGIACTVFEQAPRLSEVGAGLQLSPNGVRVLQRLGLGDALLRIAFEPRDLLYRDWKSGEVILRTPLMPDVAEHFGAPYYHAHRADLLRIISGALAPGSVRLDSRIVDVAQSTGQVTVTLEDGGIHHGEVLVGADGIHSLVRARLFQADTPQASGCIAFRGLVDADAARHLGVSPATHVWMGPDRSSVVYYVSGGRKINWIGLANSPQNRRESWSARASTAEILEAYAGWNDEIISLIKLVSEPFATALYDRQPLAHWVAGRAVLLGDAAHAMLPYHAQGAVQSIEDAWVLMRCLQQSGTAAVTTALQRYETLRRDRATRIQGQSRIAERRLHLADKAAVDARNAKMRQYDSDFAGSYLPQQQWLFGYDAELAATGRDAAWQALRPWALPV